MNDLMAATGKLGATQRYSELDHLWGQQALTFQKAPGPAGDAKWPLGQFLAGRRSSIFVRLINRSCSLDWMSTAVEPVNHKTKAVLTGAFRKDSHAVPNGSGKFQTLTFSPQSMTPNYSSSRLIYRCLRTMCPCNWGQCRRGTHRPCLKLWKSRHFPKR